MQKYSVVFAQSAFKELKNLSNNLRQRILEKIELLANDPRPSGCKKLRGRKNEYRIRIGDYRVVYTVADNILIVTIIRVTHRREVYND